MNREEDMAGNFTICVGTVGSGIWLSRNGGDEWQRVRAGVDGESRVYGLSVHPTEPRTIFAGGNGGIFRSRDGGQSFEHLDSPMNAMEVWKIAVDPVDPDIIFAGTRPAALFRSTDAGRTWQKLPAEIVDECPNVGVPRVTALTVDPSDHRVIWAGIEVDGVRRSTDGGDTWSRIANIYDLDIHDIAVTVNGGTTVLTSTPGEIFASTDRGENWRGLDVRDQFRLRYCRGLAQKADDPKTIFVATGDAAVGSTGAIQRTQNGGRSWEALPLPAEPNSPIWAFATHAADPGLIVACSHYGELYASGNAGDSWNKLPREFTEIRSLSWVPN
jgi:photosystem II stability/assembly factor-like uncharacterized protein